MKSLLISFIFLVSSFLSFSQNNWLRRAGGENHDEALDMAATSDDHFAIVGYFASGATFGNSTLSSSGFSDAFVQKVDAGGNTIWAVKLGGTKPDRATSVACDDNGNIYVTGFFTDEANFGNITLDEVSDSLEIFITKLNSDGVVQWAKACGGISDDYSYGIAVDEDANIVVTGQFREEGHFGNITLTSDMYEDNSYWSYDIFVAKLDTDGNWLWAEKGSAADDDRGLSVTTDNYNNIYVCGQFSDTITFDQQHLNDVANAGFLIKYNPNGEEQWFDKLAASQLVTYDVTTDLDHNILLTGEYSGQMAIFNDGVDFVPAGFVFNIFLSKFGQSGNMMWTSHAGSSNFCSAKAVCVGASNEAYVTGTFNCVMDEFSEEYGEGIFNSAGYRDVFVTRFNTNGDRTWERQFASSKDDYCAAIAYQGIADKPLIAGSFSNYFNVPQTESFLVQPENFVVWPYDYHWPNCSGTFCTDSNYASFIQIQSESNQKDVFFASPIDLNRQPYDFFSRGIAINPPCNRPQVSPCITNYLLVNSCDYTTCSDTLILCQEGYIFFQSNSGSQGFIGPAYSLLWNDNSTEDRLWVSQSGNYTLNVSSADGCLQWNLEVYVIVAPPACPLISDNVGVNSIPTCTPENIYLCSPDSVLLVASGFSGSEYYWSNNSTTYNDSVLVTQSGYNTFTFIDEFNCYRQSTVHVYIHPILDTISPYTMIYYNGDYIEPLDSVVLCQNEEINILIFDSLPSDPNDFILNVLAEWTVYYNGNIVFQTLDNPPGTSFIPTATGWYEIETFPTLIHPPPCEIQIPYPVIEYWIYIEIIPPPEISLEINGELFICPGDTSLIVGSGADLLQFSGWLPFDELSNDSILITEFGLYTLYGMNEYQGCVSEDWLEFEIQSKPAPYVWMEPASGVVCPGDSVQLWCEEGVEYHWIGPLGIEIDDTQSIYVSVPGFYYCILTDESGCILESNMVEVKEYSSPYLIAYPGTELCVNGQVLIQIATNDYENIQWGDPFYDSATEQWIYEAGTYEVSVTSCGITTETSITITDTDTPAFITPSSETYCPNDTLILTANAGMQGYLWEPGNVPYETLEVTEPGTYYLTTYDDLGCLGTAIYTVDEYEIDSPIAEGTILCAGESTILTATADNPVYWTTDEEGQEIVANGTVFSTPAIEEETTYYVFAQDEVCPSYPTEVIVETYFSSLPPIIGGDQSICLGADALLISPMEDGFDYLWTLPNGTTSVADTLVILNADENDEGDYTLTIADENCSASEILFFEVVPQEVLQLDTDNFIEICEGSALQINAPVEADAYTWSTPAGILNGPQSLVINAASSVNAGEYSLILTNAVCDFEVMPVVVDVNPYPDVTADPCTWFCEDGYMTIGFMNEYDWYLWSTGDSTATVAVPDTGWYSVQVANDPNCVVSTEVYVPTMECIEGFINVITCNGDGRNDFADFGVLRGQIDAVYIYNRWGNILKTLTPSNLVWDGTGRVGEKVSSGVYFYTIDYAATQKSDCGCYLPPEGYIHVFAGE